MRAKEIQIKKVVKNRTNTMIYELKDEAIKEIEQMNIPDNIKEHLLRVYELGILDGVGIVAELEKKDNLRLGWGGVLSGSE